MDILEISLESCETNHTHTKIFLEYLAYYWHNPEKKQKNCNHLNRRIYAKDSLTLALLSWHHGANKLLLAAVLIDGAVNTSSNS